MMNIDDLPDSLVEKMEGGQPIHSFESDGCSNSPDSIGGADLRPACHFHDWAYYLGGCRGQRKLADQIFYRNLITCGLSPFWSNVYFRRVRLFGAKHYNWHHGRPKGWWNWLVLFFSRYMSW